MKEFFARNRLFIAIIIAAFIIGGFIFAGLNYFADKTIVLLSSLIETIERTGYSSPTTLQPESVQPEPEVKEGIQKTPSSQCIDYTQAPAHVGEHHCVTGRVNHVYTSPKGNIFINFCADYRTCPFVGVIFSSEAYKFPVIKENQRLLLMSPLKSILGKQLVVAGIIIIIILGGLVSYFYFFRPTTEPLYPVAEVIDGDTIKVKMGHKIETVRLIGINTPEVANPYKPEECYGKEASKRTKELLKDKKVYLIPDPLSSNRDKYGRLLRYVFLPDGKLVNATLIKEGYAFNYIYQPFQFMKHFNYLEKEAREQRLGLWSEECDYYFELE